MELNILIAVLIYITHKCLKDRFKLFSLFQKNGEKKTAIIIS